MHKSIASASIQASEQGNKAGQVEKQIRTQQFADGG